MKNLKTALLSAIMLVLMPFASNAQEKNVTLDFENASTNMKLIQKYTNALQKGDVATMNAQLHQDVMIYGLGGGLDSLNMEQHKAYYTNSTSNFKHEITQDLYLPVKVTNSWNEGEWTLSWGLNTVTDKKSGQKIEIPYHTASLVVNGKIMMIRYYYDMANILSKIGWTLTPPKG
ncbi:hypothetical protein SAMN04487989_10592 [Bizionia echini]|uniref:SnoaL-like domain-containing protein n=1 Tax=Bizionia echini TaxID=649333 RepID=A0A1I5CI91_9FLAO|nr:hypothetical protein [Bizionia echini]SFN86633.1 hypothetical protein SAMN04487989_10592 [Bizionia echini]